MRSDQSTSLKIFVGLSMILVVLKIVLSLPRAQSTVPGQEAAIAWPVVVAAAVSGLMGVRLSQKAGFPEMLESKISHKQRFLFPFLLGLAVGIVLVLLDIVQPLGIPHIKFPISIAFYVFGGILAETFYRLFPIPVLVWLMSSVFLRNKWQERVFWVVAALLSLLEPFSQISGLKQFAAVNAPLIVALFGFIYAVNLTAAYLFRRYGFLANLTMRFSIYVVWHMVR